MNILVPYTNSQIDHSKRLDAYVQTIWTGGDRQQRVVNNNR